MKRALGPLNSRQIHLPLVRLTANNSVVSEMGQEWADAPDLMTDKLLICVEMIWGIYRAKERKMPLFGDNHNCALVSDGECQAGGT